MKTYEEMCEIINSLRREAFEGIREILNKRGVESINVKTYRDNEDIDWVGIPACDKNGYGVTCYIDTIRKDKDGFWVADLVDECGDPFDTWDLEDKYFYFDASSAIDIFGMIEEIFKVSDEDYNGKVYKAGEDIGDDEE